MATGYMLKPARCPSKASPSELSVNSTREQHHLCTVMGPAMTYSQKGDE
jgi:hypothetical protein